VRAEIIDRLRMVQPLQAITTFNRPNLTYEVRAKVSLAADLPASLFADGSSAIVYVLRQAECDTVAEHLKRLGVTAVPYHAGLTDTARHTAHVEFVHDRVQVAVATLAFGMGIDKPDIRRVIHV
jgi:ATP-dependent DNA helicase RecQ